MWSTLYWFRKLCFVGFELADAFSMEVDMCAMHEPVQHGIGDGGVADVLVPVVDGHLTCDDGRGFARRRSPSGRAVVRRSGVSPVVED